MLNDGERQVAPDLSGIRADHRARYEWTARQLEPGSRVVDLACGVGYGAFILAEAGHQVDGIDRDAEAIAYGRTHYPHPAVRLRRDEAAAIAGFVGDSFDAATCFETIEHLADPLPMLRNLARVAPALFASVPNEAVFPFRCAANGFRGYRFHHRHYTREEFERLLAASGWRATGWFGQDGPQSEVAQEVDGRTLIARAERAAPSPSTLAAGENDVAAGGPRHVAIVGLGPSCESYVDLAKRLGARSKLADEIWGINALGDVLACDLVFHMDDVRVQEARAAAAPDSNIAAMLGWLKRHPGPVITSQAHADYPGLTAFPLEEVINALGYAYFNSTAAYAVAYAIYRGVRKISLFGIDFSYASSHLAEKGRACLEFWLGIAAARGIEIGIAERSALMDMVESTGQPVLYGYDCLDVSIVVEAGRAKVTTSPKATPSAAEVEARYDHSRHPNPLAGGIH